MAFPSELFTDRLHLRLPAETDAEHVFSRYAQDPEVSRYMSWGPHRSIDDTREYLHRIVDENEKGHYRRLPGFMSPKWRVARFRRWTTSGPVVQFGYGLARDVWGRGIATEAARAFVAIAIAQPAIWRVQAFCDVENRTSARVLEKAGLKLEGTLRRYMVMPNLGKAPRDMLCYAKVRDSLFRAQVGGIVVSLARPPRRRIG